MPVERKDEVARLLRQRLEALRQRDGDLWSRRPRGRDSWGVPPPPSPSPDEEGLRREWLRRGRGRPLEDLLGPGTTRAGPDLWRVEETRDFPSPRGRPEALRRRLGRLLEAVPGIRDRTAARLRQAGVEDLEALRDHPRFGHHARTLTRHQDRGDAAWLTRRLARRLGPSAPLLAAVPLLGDPGDLCALDLETGGLFGGSPIVVAGTARLCDNGVRVVQWVVSGPDGEPALVEALAREMDRTGVILTFNGRSFDWPCLCGRAAYWGRPWPFDPAHLDLLPPARRAFRAAASDARLSTLAREVLGRNRAEDLPGSWVPRLYQEYLRDPAEAGGLLAAIAWHNRLDVLDTMALWVALVERAEEAP
ncbi:MAG TPA: ribonuclease H-like domain-containing protein [Myxococcota bacterium]|nr:ribonuclease H-like domain-containing protein [Myxococcota bacterium]HQK51164.1 ribonuclease H-like domain-containing protein [Myxococcota bacterium]